jgi:acyl-CoA thioester hydrolase
MTDFRFYHPIEVRYADLDSFHHVNNARYFTYMEQARASYFQLLGLWDGHDLDQLRIILAKAACDYRRPIAYGDSIRVGVATVRMGNKSFDIRHSIQLDTGEVCAEGDSTLVAYDYSRGRSVPVFEEWRERIAEFEGL